ncbi:MAG: hypothetical protein EOO68_21335 [Moraxellaceae bacterium]|nr:MAG: hypothetical protein EOO68_21335 [Moraxellaceae bacterium]
MRDRDADGRDDAWEVSVYKVFIQGVDAANKPVMKAWTALRFMPFWNDPASPDPGYRSKGFIVSGLNSFAKQVIKTYIRNYIIHNTYSAFNGAIQLKGNFLIHAGPHDYANFGWGGAGCVEVIGDFSNFKRDIAQMANCKLTDMHAAMEQVVQQGKLSVELLHAATPVFKSMGNFR